MDYAKAITFVFQDKDWLATILIGGGISLLGLFFFWTIIGPILASAVVTGYMMQLIRDVYKDPDAPLPAWDNWGKKMTDGLKLVIAQFIWGLPFFILLIPFFASMFLPVFFPDSDTAALLFAVGYIAFICLSSLYSIFFMIIHPAITINLTIHDDFGKAFDFSEIFQIIKEHLGEVLIVALLVLGVSYFANMVGMLLLLVGMFFTSFWVMLVRGHLYGQLARLVFPASEQPATPLIPTTAE